MARASKSLQVCSAPNLSYAVSVRLNQGAVRLIDRVGAVRGRGARAENGEGEDPRGATSLTIAVRPLLSVLGLLMWTVKSSLHPDAP